MKQNSLKNVLITGASGMVGSYIDFGTKLDRRALDVTDSREIEKVFNTYRPTTILHLAAETDVDRCERDPEYAYFANGIGTWNVALAAKKIEARLIYVSTVYVFKGDDKEPYKEGDDPSPPTFYGKSKYLGEIAVRGLLEDYVILRAGWMFGGGPAKDQKFIAKIMQQLDRPEIKAVDDIFGSLTYAKDLVAKIKELAVAKTPPKIIHASNEGFCSRYDNAAEIVRVMKSGAKVTPVPGSYFKLDASRSNSDRMISNNGGTMRPWQEAVEDYLKTEWQ
jgi:dTDP-4-dehydrorhamnose reductase